MSLLATDQASHEASTRQAHTDSHGQTGLKQLQNVLYRATGLSAWRACTISSAELADEIVCVRLCVLAGSKPRAKPGLWPLKKQNLIMVVDHDKLISKYVRKEYRLE
ncbi:MAG: hypothetical protein JRD05_04925 [Deltaproteobacteria bacterium]|nr:hypothetical protein [Deltaproteobacteria bacterium]